MITNAQIAALIAAWIGSFLLLPGYAHEPPALAEVPTAKVAAAKVLAPLTAEILADLHGARLAREFPKQLRKVQLASLSEAAEANSPKD